MSRTTAATEPTAQEQFAGLLRALWQAVVRATRAAERLPALPEAQVTVLRALVAGQGSTPGQLATDLHLARSTISNLVPELTAQGLVDRRPSADDGRSVLLVPTDRARRVLAVFSRGRVDVLGRALAELPATDRERLVDALPSLHRLLAQVELQAQTRAEPQERHVRLV